MEILGQNDYKMFKYNSNFLTIFYRKAFATLHNLDVYNT